MNRVRGLAIVVGALAVTGIASCGAPVMCAAGTHLEDNSCVPDPVDAACGVTDMAMSPSDMATAPTVKCGPNTMLNMANNTCEIAASACLTGTMYDPKAFSCKLPDNFGTEIWSSGFLQTYLFLARVNPNPPDGGSTYQALGTLTGGVTVMGVPDTEKLFLSRAPFVPFGVHDVPIWWAEGPPSALRTAIGHQVTFGEWKACKGTWKIYKDPPTAPKHYKEVVDFAGCPPDLLFTVWNVFGKTDKSVDRVISVPAGGLPNAFQTNTDGKAHFERDLDPDKWFKAGAFIQGVAHGSMMAQPIPDLMNNPNATMTPYALIHNDGQSNGNPRFCVRNGANDGGLPPSDCVNPPSDRVFLPGQNGVDSLVAFTSYVPPMGQDAYCNGVCKPIPLGMIQPY